MINDMYESKTLETDVLVLGSGAAGCGAAISAKGKGAKVLLTGYCGPNAFRTIQTEKDIDLIGMRQQFGGSKDW